jgi:mycoredoxin
MENEKIKVYGTSWCGDSRRARLFLDSNHIEYEWVDIEKDPEGVKFVEETNHGYRSVPTILFTDGSTLTEPSTYELSKKLGLS